MRRQSQKSQRRQQSYQKTVVEQRGLSKLKQGFFNLSTNISFNVGGQISKLKSYIQSDSSKQNTIVYILGKKMGLKQAKQDINGLIWFSYRRLPGLTKQINSDTGWGCLIRVGQMALAAGLRAFLQNKQNKAYNKLLIRYNVIVSFLENGGKQQKYSLRKIVERANYRFQLNYGDWFNATQICQTLTDLHMKDPMKGTENLILMNFKGGIVFIDEILTRMNKNICRCSKKRILCTICNQKQEQSKILESTYSRSTINNHKIMQEPHKYYTTIQSQYFSKIATPQKKLLLFISAQLGYKLIAQKQYKQLIQLLTLQCSLGIIGGVPKKGLYFVGYEGEDLLYLDPHYVQDEVIPANLQKMIRSFEYKQIRKQCRTNIDPSLAFVFFIDSLETLRKLQCKIQQLYENYQNPIISVEWTNQFRSKVRVSRVEQLQKQCQNDLQNSFIEQI